VKNGRTGTKIALRIAENGPEPNAAKRNGQHIIKPKATISQLKVAAALREEPVMPLQRKQSKIEVHRY
jgi:hypothetical protein